MAANVPSMPKHEQTSAGQERDSATALTIPGAAAALSLSTRTVYDELRAGRLSAVRIGPRAGAVRITRAEIARYPADAQSWEPSA